MMPSPLWSPDCILSIPRKSKSSGVSPVKIFSLSWFAEHDKINVPASFLVNPYDTSDIKIVNEPASDCLMGMIWRGGLYRPPLSALNHSY
jgi:hypothetical protein